jgi:hypothetical protein
VNANLHSGSTAALKVFVTVCFVVWVAISYLALFALAAVFWVAVLESQVHHGALVQYIASLLAALASAAGSLWLWKRVHDRPQLYPRAAGMFALFISLAVIASATTVIWHVLR